MTYHLGSSATYVNFPVYGWWMISSPETQMQLRAAGISVSDIPQAAEMIASKAAPVFVHITDRGSVMALSYKYLGGSSSGDLEGYNVRQGIETLREKLLRPSKVRNFSNGEVSTLTQQPSRTSRSSLDQSGPSTTENAPGASLNPAAPPAPSSPVEPGAAPATPTGPAASTASPARGKSNTGLYLGLGAGALLLLVGLGVWSKNR